MKGFDSFLIGILGIVFITLKLCDVIDWSWWWVTCPFWAFLPITFVLAIILYGFQSFEKRRRQNSGIIK